MESVAPGRGFSRRKAPRVQRSASPFREGVREAALPRTGAQALPGASPRDSSCEARRRARGAPRRTPAVAGAGGATGGVRTRIGLGRSSRRVHTRREVPGGGLRTVRHQGLLTREGSALSTFSRVAPSKGRCADAEGPAPQRKRAAQAAARLIHEGPFAVRRRPAGCVGPRSCLRIVFDGRSRRAACGRVRPGVKSVRWRHGLAPPSLEATGESAPEAGPGRQSPRFGGGSAMKPAARAVGGAGTRRRKAPRVVPKRCL